MIKNILNLSIVFVSLVLFTGCVQNEIVVSPQQQRVQGNSGDMANTDNTWGRETNIEDEEVDISDIDGNITESETIITEETAKKRVQRIPFPAAEYRQLATIGKGTVKGSIYINDMYGQRIPGRETRLYLNPVTSYSRQWYNESYLGGAKMSKADARLFNYLRFTAADSEGNFAFYGVPSGSYYLIGTVKCGSECGYDTPKNIRIATTVSVSGNQIVQKDLYKSIQ